MQFVNPPLVSTGDIANSVSLNESGTFTYLAADLGVIDPPHLIRYDQTYVVNGWAVEALNDGTRFTNNRTNEGFWVSVTEVKSIGQPERARSPAGQRRYSIAARLVAQPRSTGYDHPGHHAALLIDQISFTVAALRGHRPPTGLARSPARRHSRLPTPVQPPRQCTWASNHTLTTPKFTINTTEKRPIRNSRTVNDVHHVSQAMWFLSLSSALGYIGGSSRSMGEHHGSQRNWTRHRKPKDAVGGDGCGGSGRDGCDVLHSWN
ncbi:hypothetical protein [Mycolicibacterium peregrinum]|uniref:Uncharacterized protein n=1 Tax=Mycolicibacterium peregrinum TaxID=43304 RepID=A0A1A0VJA1_MYCPR|nr:hypothetical protein [Mycolicibacterium peregrinum]OBB83323.1 hypothetical protein A5779_07395 [Mycolicibacterium peregrinum]